MKEYFIQLGAKKLGPFSFEDLLQQQITSETLIWHSNMANPVPAHQLPELKPIIRNEQTTRLDKTGLAHPETVISSKSKAMKWFTSSNKGMRIFLMILLVVLAGAAVYYFGGKRDVVSKTEEISIIHEREVEKARQELKLEKLAKRNAEERAQLLAERKAELQSLNAQLRNVRASRAKALSDMDKIRRPHLFRSRAKKEAQLSGQLQIIDRLDAKAATLKERIFRCEEALDTLSADDKP